MATGTEAIPIVDLSDTAAGGAGRSSAARRIGIAAEKTGFFYVAAHGMPPALLDGAFDAARRFFALPEASKRAALMTRGNARGYEPLEFQQLDARVGSDIKESFQVGAETTGPLANRWPPDVPDDLRAALLRYHTAACALGAHLMELLALSLDLPAATFADAYRGANPTLRLLRYPPRPADADAGRFGAGEHTDWGGIAILAQDDAGGLEVRNAAGGWIPALPIAGTFVVNLGDLIVRWTNGRYHSTPHRVRYADTSRPRYSVVLFYSPRADAMIVPLRSADDVTAPRFAACTAGEHIQARRRETYGVA